MKKFLGAAVVAAALSLGSLMSMTPASAASPATTVLPVSDARIADQNATTDFSAQRYRHYRRHRYYRPRYYAPRPYYAPRYYAPRPYYGGGYGYRRAPGVYFGF